MEKITQIEELKKLMVSFKESDRWSIQLLAIKNTKKNGISYYTREVVLRPQNVLNELVGKIAENYCDVVSGLLNKRYERIEEYDGANIGRFIYRLDLRKGIAEDEYDRLISAVNSPDVDSEIDVKKIKGYVISGEVGDDKNVVRLILLQNPISSYANRFRFIFGEDSFVKLDKDVLQLKDYVDVIIYKGYCYMMNLSAERLFDIERSYKAICREKIDMIAESDMVSDFEMFSKTASAGHNPRRFISFNQAHYERLVKEKKIRKEMGKTFNIDITPNGIFDTTDKKNSDNLVKLLCDRAMLEPFDRKPMEVEAAKAWS